MKLNRIAAFAAALLGAWLASGAFIVRPSEQALFVRLGRPVLPPLRPGLHFRVPGLERVFKYDANRTLTAIVGPSDVIRDDSSAPDEGLFLTGDTNILVLRVAVQYQIWDPARFLLAMSDPTLLVPRMAEAALTETLADTHVDDILTGGRLLVSERVRKRTQELCDRTAVGVRVSGVALVGAEPPRDVVEAFQDVQNAKSDRERLLNEASGYANETLPRARGAALDQAGRADGERTRRVAAARGDAERFGALRQAAASDRASFRQRAYLETLERLLPRTRVFVVDPAGALRLVQPSETPKKRP